MPRQDRRLAAILAADVVGYSRLMAADEAGTLARFNALRSELIDPKIAQFKGRVVGSAGDSLLIEFPSAVDAVQCAVETQERIAVRNADLPDDRRITFRIGINLGDVIAEGESIHGDGVNVASRLERLAEPGAVVVSRSIRNQVKDKLSYAFTDLGEHALKNIAEPVRAFRAASVPPERAPELRASEALAPPDRPSIAVLAFANMSGDPEQEYFSDGIAEDIITELSRFRDLFVIARNSSFAYKGRLVKVQDIARDLGVRYVVEGSVRKAANRVRITAQLIDAGTGGHLWADRWDRPLDDIFALQDEIVEAIVGRLARSLDDERVERSRRMLATTLTAYDRLLRGRRAWVQSDFAGALAHLDAAVALDPTLAQAYAIMAFLHGFESWMRNTDFLAFEAKARELAERALTLDPRDAYAQALVGWFHLFVGEHEAALRCTERAVTLNRNDVTAMAFHGGTLAYCGRAEEGLTSIEWALRVDPFGWSERWSEVLVECLYMARKYEDCIAAFGRMQNPAAYEFVTLAACYAQLGRLDEARAALDEFERRRPPRLTVAAMVQGTRRMCRIAKDFDHWLEGYRKAGIEV